MAKAYAEGHLNELLGNYSLKYAPLIESTLETGNHALSLAALTLLAEGETRMQHLRQ